MKGLVLLFVSVVLLGIFWRYADKKSKTVVTKLFTGNILFVVLAFVAVAVAVFFSINTSVRLI